MPTPPKIPGKDIIEGIMERVARFDREPFHEHLANAIAVGPSKTSIRKLAKKNPESWSRYVGNLAKLTGYADKKESVTVKVNASELVQRLVARAGIDGAQKILETLPNGRGLMGFLPAIEGEATETTDG